MKLELSDKLLIKYGDRVLKARPANGIDNIKFKEDGTLKVILEGDNSYNPIAIYTRDLVSVNGEEV